MSQFDSPYQSPLTPNPQPSAGPIGKLKGPAIALLICAPFGIILMIVDLVGRVMNINNDTVPVFGNNAQAALAGVYIGMVVDVLAMICQIVVIVGAVSMLKGQSYASAMAASVISVIPCLSACCVLGIPFGIWALVVLNDPGVKTAFRS